ncbi:unnamed protein product [Lampetra planeri]
MGQRDNRLHQRNSTVLRCHLSSTLIGQCREIWSNSSHNDLSRGKDVGRPGGDSNGDAIFLTFHFALDSRRGALWERQQAAPILMQKGIGVENRSLLIPVQKLIGVENRSRRIRCSSESA